MTNHRCSVLILIICYMCTLHDARKKFLSCSPTKRLLYSYYHGVRNRWLVTHSYNPTMPTVFPLSFSYSFRTGRNLAFCQQVHWWKYPHSYASAGMHGFLYFHTSGKDLIFKAERGGEGDGEIRRAGEGGKGEGRKQMGKEVKRKQ